MRQRIRRRASPVLQAAVLAAISAAGLLRNTRLDSPPRFDGAGYAVLARSLLSGRGYNEIDHPESPRHAHFPPGYPLTLAILWRLTGISSRAAHLLSVGCTVGAVLITWRWLRMLYPGRIAWLLGLALACNWRWQREGGAIQSEPLFLLISSLALLLTSRAGRREGSGAGFSLGGLLGAAVLTRHAGLGLAVACWLDQWLRRRRGTAIRAALLAMLLILPWAVWLLSVGRNSQAGLLRWQDLGTIIAGQALFYARRLPDQIVGPLTEIATVFRLRLAIPATLCAIVATGVIAAGWLRCLHRPRRRLAALVPLATLLILLVWPFTEAGRFLIPLIPFILIGMTEGLATTGKALGSRRPRRVAAALVLLVSIPYSAYAAITDRAEAQRRSQADFDAACAWITRHAKHPGPILTRHPGEVFWQTGRSALAPTEDDPAALDALIERYGVAYLLVDDDRYVNAARNPLSRYAAERSRRVALRMHTGAVTVHEVVERP